MLGFINAIGAAGLAAFSVNHHHYGGATFFTLMVFVALFATWYDLTERKRK